MGWPPRPTTAPHIRFKQFVRKARHPKGCWVWTGSRHGKGYGHFRIGRNVLKAHRVAWELVNGTVPAGMQVLHRCDNPSCVRPSHLFLGTTQDNTADRDAKMRLAFSVRNGKAKLNPVAVRAIRKDTRSNVVVAAEYGVSSVTISHIRTRRRWTWLA